MPKKVSKITPEEQKYEPTQVRRNRPEERTSATESARYSRGPTMIAMRHHRPRVREMMFKATIPGEMHTRADEDMEDDEAYTSHRAKVYRQMSRVMLEVAEANPAKFLDGQVDLRYRRRFLKSILTHTRRNFNWTRLRGRLVGRKTLALFHPTKNYSTGNMIEEVAQIRWLNKIFRT